MSERQTLGNIWPQLPILDNRPSDDREGNFLIISDRAGGGYEISVDALPLVETLDDGERARLTTWLVEQRGQGVPTPLITPLIVEYARTSRTILVHERADRLLKQLISKSRVLGNEIQIGCEGKRDKYGEWIGHDSPTIWNAMARTESISEEEIQFLTRYLVEQRWIEAKFYGRCVECTVLVDGYTHSAELSKSRQGDQGFVAMWFDESMDEVFRNGIAKGIDDAGYRPFRIDRKDHINKIDDEIMAEIRDSKFLVADFTQGTDGPRGGVYYEAGFARGLGIPVFYTCRKNMVDKLHFDTRQFNHILWETPEELCGALRNRIEAVIQKGPHFQSSWA